MNVADAHTEARVAQSVYNGRVNDIIYSSNELEN